MPEPVVALVMAAGSGTRFGGPVPKAVAPLGDSTVVGRSVDALTAGGCTAVVVVAASSLEPDFSEALADCPLPLTIVGGGATRQESVLRGLEAIAANPDLAATGIVLVHDAVRPLVPADVVAQVVAAVRTGAVAVTPAVPVVDSLRRVDADGNSQPVDRAGMQAVQTPQGFHFPTLLASHRLAAAQGVVVTDDVGACEAAGHPVSVVPGALSAFKITHAADLDLARALVQLWQEAGR